MVCDYAGRTFQPMLGQVCVHVNMCMHVCFYSSPRRKAHWLEGTEQDTRTQKALMD
jgi:hypothetical protein